MGELEDDIRATTESIANDIEALKGIEIAKARLPADDPNVQELSAEAARLGDRLAAETHAEEELARQASKDSES